MMQLRIQVLDIDDNPPLFSQENITTGESSAALNNFWEPTDSVVELI